MLPFTGFEFYYIALFGAVVAVVLGFVTRGDFPGGFLIALGLILGVLVGLAIFTSYVSETEISVCNHYITEDGMTVIDINDNVYFTRDARIYGRIRDNETVTATIFYAGIAKEIRSVRSPTTCGNTCLSKQ